MGFGVGLGIGVGIGGGGAAAFTPAADPTAFVWDSPATAIAAGRLWQDLAKTTRATADTHPIRVWTDAKGNDWIAPSDAARPVLYSEGGGKWSFAFNGVSSSFVCLSLGSFTGRYLIQRLIYTSGNAGWAVWISSSSDPKDFYVYDGAIYCSFGTTTRRGPITPTKAVTSYQTAEVMAGSTWQMLLDGESQASYGTNTNAAMSSGVTIGSVGTAFAANRLAGIAIASAVPDATLQAKYQAWAGAL